MQIILGPSSVRAPRFEAVGRRVIVFFCLTLLLAGQAAGQGSRSSRLLGQVSFPPGAEKLPPELVRVVLTDARGVQLGAAVLSPDASFSFRGVRSGQYVVTVSSPGFRSSSQMVDVPRRTFEVRVLITLGPRQAEGGPEQGEETVSVASLKIPQKAQRELEKGRQRLKKGNAEKAIDHFDKALELCSGCYQAYAGLGSSYAFLGRWPEARKNFKKSIFLDPQNPNLRRQLAQTCLREKSFDEALEQLRIALGIEPRSGETQVLLGEVYLGLKECGTALNYFQTASQMNPGEHSCLGLGRSYYCTGRNIEALAEFREFVEYNPADPRSETVRQFIVDLEKAIRPN